MAVIRIGVVDDHPLFREGVISHLRGDPGYEVVGEGASADDAARIASDARPDVMLLDISMPGGGINALLHIVGTGQPTKVIMLTVSENGEDVLAALEIGAFGYLLKGVHKSELIDAVRAVHQGETVVDPNLGVRIIGWLRKAESTSPTSFSSPDQLTPREAEILDYVSQGLTNKEIGTRLNLTPRTVKNYMTIIMMKLQVRNRVEAALSVRRAARLHLSGHEN